MVCNINTNNYKKQTSDSTLDGSDDAVGMCSLVAALDAGSAGGVGCVEFARGVGGAGGAALDGRGSSDPETCSVCSLER